MHILAVSSLTARQTHFPCFHFGKCRPTRVQSNLFDNVWGIGFGAMGSLPWDYCMSGDNLMGWIGSKGNLGDVEYDLGPNKICHGIMMPHNLLTWWMIGILCWSDSHRSLDLCQSTILFACGNIWKGAWQSGSCRHKYIDGLVVQDCSNSSALAMELLQSCTEPSIYSIHTISWEFFGTNTHAGYYILQGGKRSLEPSSRLLVISLFRLKNK